MNRRERAEQLLSGAILVAMGFAASLTKDYISKSEDPWSLVVIWAIIIVAAVMYYYAGSRESAAKSAARTELPPRAREDRPAGPKMKVIVRPPPEPRKRVVTRSETPEGTTVRTEEAPACSRGPHAVEAGHPEAIPLDVKTGDQLRGYLEEIDGFDFSWFIANAANLAKFRQGRRPTVLAENLDVPADSISVTIPGDGPWYLVLDVYGKQYTREVVTELFRKRQIG